MPYGVCIYIYIYIYVCMYVCMYLRTYVCMYVFTNVQIRQEKSYLNILKYIYVYKINILYTYVAKI